MSLEDVLQPAAIILFCVAVAVVMYEVFGPSIVQIKDTKTIDDLSGNDDVPPAASVGDIVVTGGGANLNTEFANVCLNINDVKRCDTSAKHIEINLQVVTKGTLQCKVPCKVVLRRGTLALDGGGELPAIWQPDRKYKFTCTPRRGCTLAITPCVKEI